MTRLPFALGTIPFGTAVDEQTTFAILDRFAEAGGTMLDTSNNYPFWRDGATGDESELAIGRWLASRGARDRIVLGTKCGARPTVPGDRTLGSAEGLSAKTIAAAAEGSLRRLGTDRIDVYWSHIEDRSVPLEETLGAFGELAAAGKVREIGASNLPAWRLERARAVSRANGWAPYTHLQLRHSYLRPRPDVPLESSGHTLVNDDTLDYLRQEPEVSLWAYSTLLSGGYTRADRPLEEAYDHPGTTRRLAVLREVAAELGATPNQVVLAWLTGGSPAVVPIVGVSGLAQLEEAIGAAGLKLDDELRARLDAAH
ncbi:aldo/keto reductase [Planomonospora venezuelensis]|uniref:Aryl-alcohol dehydrogenase-like predicted oxidoreductase n=1 Tax=Planomonospora venezuelensis TaxID=1999 RepID=A0A841D3R1_PLAVE|nr:aldo/keto reductase [Planomonospora venezuelensis]MBB5963134.1 aryl-alcohol dehydrogenase-like predicted oxidoreductase [Planomonospora venezuelensis]GIN00009.1 oxidoreductase [Planomonospora venezuelensis]